MNAHFTIVKSVVHALKGGPIGDSDHVRKRKTVAARLLRLFLGSRT